MPRRHPTGKLPADTAPITKGDVKPGAGIDDLGTRLENLTVTRGTPLMRMQAAIYLVNKGQPRETAEYLGVELHYDRVQQARERQE